MLEPRIYRAAFLPLLFALVVAGFSLHARPRPIATTLPPDAFDGDRATRTLDGLYAAFPARRPGSPGDDALADRVRNGFRTAFCGNADPVECADRVQERTFRARTIDGEQRLRTIVASRPGRAEHQIVVLATRDAAARGSKAELSATAGLLELAEVFAGRVTRHTLTLVSTSGGTGGNAGAEDFARHHGGPVDAVIVLGDLASTHSDKPWVVPWSNARGFAPLRLVRTAERSVAEETGAPPGVAHWSGQFLRQAFPLTVSAQGPIDAHEVPAVLVGPGGELGSPADAGTSPEQLRHFGRAALRTVTALDNATEIAPVPETGIVVRGQVLPAWAIRIIGGALLLPALLAAIDGFFRVRRRHENPGPWMLWALAGALPFVLTALFLVAARAIDLLGSAPSAPVAPGEEPVEGPTLVVALAVLAAGWWLARLWVVRRLGLGRLREPAPPAAGVALLTVLVVLAVWLRNPYSGALLIPAAHAWLLAMAPETRPRRGAAWLVALGLVPLALALFGYGIALRAGPVDLAWLSALAVAGGHVSPLGVLLGSLVLGCAASALVVVLRTRIEPPPAVDGKPDVVSRGPLTYAGPGSLGGTESALRR
jgi:hypothetical protein